LGVRIVGLTIGRVTGFTIGGFISLGWFNQENSEIFGIAFVIVEAEFGNLFAFIILVESVFGDIGFIFISEIVEDTRIVIDCEIGRTCYGGDIWIIESNICYSYRGIGAIGEHYMFTIIEVSLLSVREKNSKIGVLVASLDEFLVLICCSCCRKEFLTI
jgi:hypothetical protein